MIWLVDYTHYQYSMDNELAQCKRDYFKIKKYVRDRVIGTTAPVKTRSFSNGLLRIATLLDRAGVPVRFIHYYMLNRLLNTCPASELPEIIAFSSVCPTIPYCAEMVTKIKQIDKSIRIYIGGPHINHAYKTTKQKFPEFDGYSLGYEADAASFIAGREIPNVLSPYVDYSLLPFPLYEYSINTFTAMGCPFNCDYCYDGMAPHFKASTDGQIGIMKDLLPEKTLVHVFDSVLGYNYLGALQLCETLKSIDHRFILSCDMRADLITPLLLSKMMEAGFAEIRIGFETGSDSVAERNHRTILPSKIIEKLKMVREYSDLYIAVYSVTGLPGTNLSTHKASVDAFRYLLCDRLVDEVKNSMYVPYPIDGVNYADRGVYISDEDWKHYDRASRPVYHTDELSEDELWELLIQTAKVINESWLDQNGFASIDDVIPSSHPYYEYHEYNYGLYKNTERGQRNDD